MGRTGLEPHEETPVNEGVLDESGAENGAYRGEKLENERIRGESGGKLADAILAVQSLPLPPEEKADIVSRLIDECKEVEL